MSNPKKISLFYWSEKKFFGKHTENYGDLISPYLVEKISGREIKWVHPKKQPWFKIYKTNFLVAGSIIHHATRQSIVWGSGIIDRSQQIAPADFRAVRGPQTRKYLLEQNYNCPAIYGDPALLMPIFFNPPITKKYKIGIIPHYNDYKEVSEQYRGLEGIAVIDLMTLNVEHITRQILECEQTISSSLHGIIVSHAYNIPSVWVEFSNRIFGDGIKYRDYLESVELLYYKPPFLKDKISLEDLIILIQNYPNLPQEKKVIELQEGLMKSCPLKYPNNKTLN